MNIEIRWKAEDSDTLEVVNAETGERYSTQDKLVQDFLNAYEAVEVLGDWALPEYVDEVKHAIEDALAEALTDNAWYAVERDADDNDWGYGSYDYRSAVDMAKVYGDSARIAVIDMSGGDAVCDKVITADEFEDYL